MNKTIIFQEFEKGNTCIFNNDRTARFFLIQYALEKGPIEKNKAISMDTFKSYFIEEIEGLIVDNKIRELFIASFLKENNLSYFICEKYPESLNRLSKYISTLLPQLKRVLKSKAFNKLEENMKNDINLLYKNYCDFLSLRNLIEPSFLDYSFENASSVVKASFYSIISSDTCPDVNRFLDEINNPQNIRCIKSLDYFSDTEIECFSTSVSELRTQCRRIAYLLKEGVNLNDIIISLCDFENNIIDLEVECRKLDIPLSSKIYESLSKYPGGRFFLQLKNLYDECFSLDSMKTFFLDRGFPFKEHSKLRTLIRIAIDANINHGSIVKGNDIWEEKLSKDKNINSEFFKIKLELLAFYRSFKSYIILINEANTINQIKINIENLMNLLFVSSFFDETVGSDSFKKANQILEEEENALKICDFDSIDNLYNLFVENIINTKYRENKEEGILVLPYPETSSLDVPYHFVLNLTHEDSEVIYSPMKLLPESIDQDLKEEENMSKALLNDYALSSGKTYLSFSIENYKGAQLAPSFFIENARVSKQKKLNQINDIYNEELLYWQYKSNKFMANFQQSKGFKEARINILNPPDFNMSKKVLSKSSKERIINIFKKGGEEISLSSSKIDLFYKCPFAYLMQYGFSVNRESYDYESLDHLEVGNFLHKVMEIFFKKVKKETKRFYSGEVETYKKYLKDIFNYQLEEYSISAKSPSYSTLIYLEDHYIDSVLSILNEEVINFDSTISLDFEKSIKSEGLSLTSQGKIPYILSGKIDRIINLGEGNYAIIDYKKGSATIKAKPFKKGVELKELKSYQFPCYRKLLKHLDMEATKAAYFGFKDCKYEIVWENDELLLEDVDDLFDSVIANMLDKIYLGDFRATPSKENCASCSFRQVCRRRYSTKC